MRSLFLVPAFILLIGCTNPVNSNTDFAMPTITSQVRANGINEDQPVTISCLEYKGRHFIWFHTNGFNNDSFIVDQNGICQ